METHRKTLLHLLKERAYKKGNFTLSSGKESEHYINCKPVTLSCEGNALCSHLMIEHVEDESVAVGGLTLVKRHVYPRVGLRAPAVGTLVERLAEALVPNQQMRVASVRWSHCAGAEHRRRAIGRNGGLCATISLAFEGFRRGWLTPEG